MSNPRFSTQTADGLPDPEIFSVPDGSTQLCLTWDYNGFEPGAPFDFGWNINGDIDPNSISSGSNPGSVDGTYFGCVNNDAGLAPGLYEAVWNVDGEGVFAHGIYVGDGRATHTIGLQNNTDQRICSVQWAPVDAVSNGIPRNATIIEPGED